MTSECHVTLIDFAMSFFSSKINLQEYVDSFCKDICESLATGSERIVEWYHSTSPFGTPRHGANDATQTDENVNDVVFVPIKPRGDVSFCVSHS